MPAPHSVPSVSAVLPLLLAGCALAVDDRIGSIPIDHDAGGATVWVDGDAAVEGAADLAPRTSAIDRTMDLGTLPEPTVHPSAADFTFEAGADPTWDGLLAQARVHPSAPPPVGSGVRPVAIDPVGRFAMTLESTSTDGCSRGMSRTHARGALTLDLDADGVATVCRARITHSQSLTVRTRGGEAAPLRRFEDSTHESRERTGYRGRWERLDHGALAIAMVRDDAGCDPVAEGARVLTAPLVLRCTPVAGRIEGAGMAPPGVTLPGRGLACTPMGDTRHEHYNWDAGVDLGSILLGPGHGWAIRRTRGRAMASELAITRRTEPTRVADVLDAPHTF